MTVSIEQTLKGPDVRRSARSSSSAAPSATTRCGSTACRNSRSAIATCCSSAKRAARPARSSDSCTAAFASCRIRARRGHGPDPRRTAARQHRRRRQRRPPARVAPARTLTLADFVGAIRDKVRTQAQAAQMNGRRAHGRRSRCCWWASCGRALSSYVLIERQMAGRHGDAAAAAGHAWPRVERRLVELRERSPSRRSVNGTASSAGCSSTPCAIPSSAKGDGNGINNVFFSNDIYGMAFEARRARGHHELAPAQRAHRRRRDLQLGHHWDSYSGALRRARTTSAVSRCTSSDTCWASRIPTTTARPSPPS